jgi:hypothetical protein
MVAPVEAIAEEFQSVPEATQPLPERPMLLAPLDAGTPPVHTAGVTGMKRGTWIEYRQEDATPLRAKLFWISPLKGLYLFTNRLGQRAISITAEGLERKLRNGEVSIVDSAPLIERAVGRMVEQLQQRAV